MYDPKPHSSEAHTSLVTSCFVLLVFFTANSIWYAPCLDTRGVRFHFIILNNFKAKITSQYFYSKGVRANTHWLHHLTQVFPRNIRYLALANQPLESQRSSPGTDQSGAAILVIVLHTCSQPHVAPPTGPQLRRVDRSKENKLSQSHAVLLVVAPRMRGCI